MEPLKDRLERLGFKGVTVGEPEPLALNYVMKDEDDNLKQTIKQLKRYLKESEDKLEVLEVRFKNCGKEYLKLKKRHEDYKNRRRD